MLNKHKLSDIYRKYGFTEEISSTPDIVVFSKKVGVFNIADIIPLKKIDVNGVFEYYKELGYACKKRTYYSHEDAQKELFSVFFSIESTKERLRKEYSNFKELIVKKHSEYARHSFTQSRKNVNWTIGINDLTKEIGNKIKFEKPMLFLIEVSTKFGRTCAAYEILHYLINHYLDVAPLFTELSKNRQANIFRYVLLDEIDRSFPFLSSSLVINEIKNGNIPVILDGLDELFHESANDEYHNYEKTEPMLETISELLSDKAKIILTTRRTAIFDGDNFHQWISSHNEDFEVIRIRIHEPQIEE